MSNKSRCNYQDRQEERLLKSCRARAKKKGLDFLLIKEDIVIPEYCPYFNTKLTNITNDNKVFSNASIDRKDSSLGYTKDNIQIISVLANMMKFNSTEEELITFAKGVLKLHAGIDVDKVITELSELQQVSGLRKD